MVNANRLVTVKELSAYLRVHPSTIYRLLKKGELPGFKLGSDWRFNLEAIDRWRAGQGGLLEEATRDERN
jgi:excisionase family DNA binding protein